MHTIIGAGVSGLSSAQLLKEKGFETTVLEKSSKPGGLIKCDVVDGHLFHRVGGHVFNTKVEKVNDWFWNRFNKEQDFIATKRNAGIFMQEQFLAYPLENSLYKFDEGTIRNIFNELIDLDQQASKEYHNFEDFLKGNFGNTLYQLYFKPYNHKIWKTDLSQVALPWLDGKLPMPNHREIIMSNILRKEEGNMVHSSFFYPEKNGSQFIADNLAKGLNIQYNQAVNTLQYNNNAWVINEAFNSEYIVYTGDIRLLHQMIKGVPSEIQEQLVAVSNLQSNGTSNLLCETDASDHSWLYLPDEGIPAHRIIYTGNFSANNQPKDGRASCTVEFSGYTPVEEMEKAIKKLPGNLKMIDYNYEANSYVIQQQGDREKINALKNSLAQYNIYLVGRFAEWEYHNMDKAIESSMHLADQF
ncbi:protoporphyrinogen/coproporphyrinogen oxidase [Labilibacter marinus]|uniref:protoporphyrinogen/coproporphyrinogen oxidase n=1 Tax=Labilibacter marinus TaxID=1477105 RepID=UPI0009F81547|nr:NAD(P)-binding protein [Labilibacter marinus]